MCTEVNCFRFKDELVKKSFLLVDIWNFLNALIASFVLLKKKDDSHACISFYLYI